MCQVPRDRIALTSETKPASQIVTHKHLGGTANGSCLFLPLLLFLEFLLREVRGDLGLSLQLNMAQQHVGHRA